MRIAINGFGRIGRLVARAAANNPNLNIVAINDPSPPQTLAHLLKYDSVHGQLNESVTLEDGNLRLNHHKIKLSHTRNVEELPWHNDQIDMIFECSGFYASKEKSEAFLQYADKVLIFAPATGADATIVYGVNHQSLTAGMQVVSNASCTTNCLAPVVAPLHEAFGVASGLITTIHAFTNDQRLCDGSHKDLRRARAATTSMIPTKTGAASAIGLVIPALNNKLDGIAVRVPTSNVSLVDATLMLNHPADATTINQCLQKAAEGSLKGVLATSDLPLVSCDYNGNPHSSIVDTSYTKTQDNQAKILAWYDNEWGFACRMIDTATHWHNL